MTDPHYTAIALLVDRSGSMSSIKDATDGAIAEYISGQVVDARTDGGRRTLRLTTFDTEVEIVHGSTPIEQVPPFALQPRGMTALHDAMGTQITAFGDELAALPEPERPGHVVFVVVTDGLENASREYTGPGVKAMVEHQHDVYGWEFVYLGANQDAVTEGAKLGVPQHGAITYDASPETVAAVVAAAGAYTSASARGYQASFSDDDRRRARTGPDAPP